MTFSIYSEDEQARRECARTCEHGETSYSKELATTDGEARKCPHGQWLVFHRRNDHDGDWEYATARELRRINKLLKGKR